MHIEPSAVSGVELIGPDAPEFRMCIESLVRGAPPAALQTALPYSVVVKNSGERPLVLLGIRFDMLSRQKKPYSVVHYADTLRYPDKPGLAPGAFRFVCAEPRYTAMVLRGESHADSRGAMNLVNLATALRVAASLDCVAFTDGEFAGPDSHGAFDRFRRERDAESALIGEVLEAGSEVEAVLVKAIEQSDGPPRRALAKVLLTAFQSGGADELAASARSHRIKLQLWRA